MTDRPFTLALVLGGGNALGSYQAGVYQALAEQGIEPDRIVGCSIGALNGAIIAGNAPADRLARLGEFWRRDPGWGCRSTRRCGAPRRCSERWLAGALGCSDP